VDNVQFVVDVCADLVHIVCISQHYRIVCVLVRRKWQVCVLVASLFDITLWGWSEEDGNLLGSWNVCENVHSNTCAFVGIICLKNSKLLLHEIRRWLPCSSSHWRWQGSCVVRTIVPRYRTQQSYQYVSSCSTVMGRKATRNGKWKLV